MAAEPHYIDVDLKKSTHYKTTTVTQNDTDVVFILRVSDDGRSDESVLDNFSTVTLTSQRRDGQSFYVLGEKIPGTNEVRFALGTKELELTGKVSASAQLYSVDGRQSSAKFNYNVEGDLTGDYVPTETEATLIEIVLMDGPATIAEAEQVTAQTVEALELLETEKTVAFQELDDVKEDNKLTWKPEVATVALRNSTYPNPQNGDTVRITEEARIDRFNGTEWITTDRYNPAAVDQLTVKLAEKANRLDVFLKSKGININDLDEPTRQAFLEAQGIDVNYILGEGNVKGKNVADKTIGEEHVTFVSAGLNIFKGNYQAGNITGNATTGGSISNNPDGRIAIIEVSPNTTYTAILEKTTDRFRIATHTEYPVNGVLLKRYIKPELVGADSYPHEIGYDYFTFTTESDENHIVVYVSLNNEEPRLMLSKGGIPPRIEDYKVILRDNVDFQGKSELGFISNNIIMGKNLFNQEYVVGTIRGSVDSTVPGQPDITSNNGWLAIIDIKPNTSYSISKTSSNRFRIATSEVFPRVGTKVRRLTPDSLDNLSEVTIVTRENDKYLIVHVSSNGEPPEFMQIEESPNVTEWETYGYKMEPQAKEYKSIGIIQDRSSDGKVYVNDFGGDGKSDTETIQDAFDYANGNIVVFNPEKAYVIDNTVLADAAKVRGIDGQNALIQIRDADTTVLKYKGSKDTGSANPAENLNQNIAIAEMNPFIKHLRVSSFNKAYVGTGIDFEGTYGLLVENCHAFNLGHGFRVSGINRNFILANNNIWHNSGYGVFWDNANVHQQNLTGNHISYNKRALYFENSDMHNIQIVGNDIESNSSPASGNPESLIHFHLDADKPFVYEAIHIVGNSLQDHITNTAPLLKFDSLKNNGIQDLILGNNQLANSVEDSFWARGLDRATITGNSVKANSSPQSFNFEGVNKNISMSGNHLLKGVKWSGETTKLAIVGNIANGFSLPDSNDGKVLVANNF